MTHEPLSFDRAVLLNQRAIAKRKVATVLQYVFAIVVTLFMVFPLYWMFITSVKSQEEVLLALPTFWPREWHFENYRNVLSRANFSKYYYNTIVMTAGILFSQVVTGVLAAYGFWLVITNQQSISLNLLFIETSPLNSGLVVVLSFIFGAMLGVFAALFIWHVIPLRWQLRQAQKELATLRKQYVKPSVDS